MKTCKIILTILSLCIASGVSGAMPQWEFMGATAQSYELETEKLDVSVNNGYIYVTTTKPVTVKLLSILGQLVTQQNLPAGVSRIKVPAQGMYILKAGPITRRITIRQ